MKVGGVDALINVLEESFKIGHEKSSVYDDVE